MTPDRWLQVKALFYQAIDLDLELREAHVRDAASGDTALVEAVLELLRADADRSDLRSPLGEFNPETSDLTVLDNIDPAGFVLGNYRLGEKVGQGGMGVVYRAYDQVNHRDVALKTLQHSTPQRLHLFKREFRGFANLLHPNLVTLYELLSDGTRWCFTMEFVEGQPLLVYIEHQPLHLRAVLCQLITGVAALHSAGKLHRDLKPSNVKVTPQGRVVIFDFGIGRPSTADSVTEDQLFGTAAYVSPEQVRGAEANEASDWYSVGTMLFEILTGRLPFTGPPLAMLQAKASTEAPDPKSLNPAAPEDLNDLCVRLLRSDPAERPEAAAILAMLAIERVAPAEPAQDEVRQSFFVGREAELQALREAHQLVRREMPIVVHVRGRSGAGKTALVREFLRTQATAEEGVVLRGRCHQQEDIPFKAFDSVMDSLVHYLRKLPPLELTAVLPREVRILGRLFPAFFRVPGVEEAPVVGGSEVSAQELRRRGALALRELLARIGDRWHLILFIDDIHWGDADSASLLVDLLTPPDAPLFLCIGCYRSEDSEESAFLSTLRELRRLAIPFSERYVDLEELGVHETRDLTRKLLDLKGDKIEEIVETVVAESLGRPLLVYDLIEHVKERSDHAESEARLTLGEIVWRRIEAMPQVGRDLLTTVAVSGRPIELALANSAARIVTDEPLLRLLSTERLLRRTPATRGQKIEVYHDRVRQSILEHLSDPVLFEAHQRLAATLRHQPETDDERIAFHLYHGGRVEEAAEFYAKAATTAAGALSFEQSALLYRQALKLKSWSEQQAVELRRQLADALNYAGRASEAAQEYVAASAGAATESISIDLQHRAALALLTAGHVDEGLARLRPVLKSANLWLARAPWSALLSLLLHRIRVKMRGMNFLERAEGSIDREVLRRIDIGWSVVVGLSIIDPIRGADFQTRSLLLALEAGEPFRVARALAVEAAHLASSAEIKEAERTLDLAQRLSARIDHPYTNAITGLAKGTVSYFTGNWQESLAACRNAAAEFQHNCTGATWEVDTANAFCLWSLAKMGDIRELSRQSPLLLKDAHERGDLYAVANLSTQIMAMVRLGADEPDPARATLSEVMSQWSQSGYHVQHHDALLAFVPLELYTGNPEAAWQRIQAEWVAFRWSLLSHVQDLRVEMLQLRAYCALALSTVTTEAQSYRISASKDALRLRKEKLPWTFALADFIDGAVLHLEGHDPEACEKLKLAIQGFDSLNAGLHAASTRMRLAQLEVDGGLTLQTQAMEWFDTQQIKAPQSMLDAFAPGFKSQASRASNP